MKYIINIDYRDIESYNEKNKGQKKKIKEIDYQLLQMLWQFASSGNAKSFNDNELVYYWFTSKLIQDQFPEWGVGRTTCFNKLSKLIDLGLLDRHPEGKSFQGYYRFTKICQTEFPSLSRAGMKSSSEPAFDSSSFNEIKELNQKIKALEKDLKKKTSIVEGKEEYIKKLLETINGQEALILELQGVKKSRKEKFEPGEASIYSLCKEVYQKKHEIFYKEVFNSSADFYLTIKEEKALRDLTINVENAMKQEYASLTSEDIKEAFSDILDVFILMAKDKEIFYGQDFTPSNLLRNFTDFFAKMKTKINNGAIRSNKQNNGQDSSKSGLEERLEKIRTGI